MSALTKSIILIVIAVCIVGVVVAKKHTLTDVPRLPSETAPVAESPKTQPSTNNTSHESSSIPSSFLKTLITANQFASIEECGTGYGRVFRVRYDVRSPDASTELFNISGTHIATCSGYTDGEPVAGESSFCAADTSVCKQVYYPSKSYEGDSHAAVDIYNLN